MAKKTRPSSINQAQVLRTVEERIAGADEARRDRLGALSAVTAIRAELFDQEARRLAVKYGANHQRVAETNFRAQAGVQLLNTLKTEMARVSLSPPAPQDDAWIVFGMVRTADGSPVRDVFVVLADHSGHKAGPDTTAQTDRDGSYRIVLTGVDQVKRAVQVDAEAADAEGSVHLEVFRTTTRRLAVDPVAFRPAAGVVDYRDVVVGTSKRTEQPKA